MYSEINNNFSKMSSAKNKLNSAIISNRRRDQNLSDRKDFYGDQVNMSGESRISGGGDVKIDIPFAVKFVEKPIFVFGGETMDPQALRVGSYPSISAFVCEWITEERLPTSVFYTGAVVAVSISSGDAQSKYILHYNFSGIGFASPA